MNFVCGLLTFSILYFFIGTTAFADEECPNGTICGTLKKMVDPPLGRSGTRVEKPNLKAECSGPNTARDQQGWCRISNQNMNCVEGVRESEVSGYLECHKANGHFTLYANNGERVDNFGDNHEYSAVEKIQQRQESTEGSSGDQYAAVGNISTAQSPNFYLTKVGSGDPSVVNSRGEYLLNSSSWGCSKLQQNKKGGLDCLSGDGQNTDSLSLHSLKTLNSENISLENLVDKVAIDLCRIAQNENASKGKAQPSSARVTKGSFDLSRMWNSGVGYQLGEKKLNITLVEKKSEAFAAPSACSVNGKTCEKILVDSKSVICANKDSKIVIEEGEQSRDKRVDLLKKEVFQTSSDEVKVREFLHKLRANVSGFPNSQNTLVLRDKLKNILPQSPLSSASGSGAGRVQNQK